MTAPTPTTLVLIRHGESNVTVNRVIGGYRTCSGLSELGRRQADRLRDRLATTGELAADVLIASKAPGGRGELPQVLTTVASVTGTPASTQATARRRTSRLTLSIKVAPYTAPRAPATGVWRAPARHVVDDGV